MSEGAAYRAHIAIIGGATAGAEAADRLAAEGAMCVVFEQNDRPYGKVEDGLPAWHEALRQKEYGIIDSKLTREGEARFGLGCGAGGSGVFQSWDGSAAHLTCSGVTVHASCAGSYHSQDQNSH